MITLGILLVLSIAFNLLCFDILLKNQKHILDKIEELKNK